MADCVGVGLLQNFHFHNFAKFSEIFNFMFSEIFLQFCKIKNYCVKILRNTKFCQNNFDFREIQGKFRENKIKNFVKISRSYKNEISQQPYAGVECGGGRRASTAIEYSPGASSALTQIVPYSSSVSIVFHSVLYNSVLFPHRSNVYYICSELSSYYYYEH